MHCCHCNTAVKSGWTGQVLTIKRKALTWKMGHHSRYSNMILKIFEIVLVFCSNSTDFIIIIMIRIVATAVNVRVASEAESRWQHQRLTTHAFSLFFSAQYILYFFLVFSCFFYIFLIIFLIFILMIISKRIRWPAVYCKERQVWIIHRTDPPLSTFTHPPTWTHPWHWQIIDKSPTSLAKSSSVLSSA